MTQSVWISICTCALSGLRLRLKYLVSCCWPILFALGGCAAPAMQPADEQEMLAVSSVAYHIRDEYVHDIGESQIVRACADALQEKIGPLPEKSDALIQNGTGTLRSRLRNVMLAAHSVEPGQSLHALAGECMRGMMSGLDAKSRFFDEAEIRRFQSNRNVAGVGLELAGDGRIVSSIEDSPAALAGIQPGDRLVTIDQTPVQGRPLPDIVSLLQGEAGSAVDLGIERPGEKQGLNFKLVRQLLRVKTVRIARLDPDTLYIRISSLRSDTRGELMTGIQDALKADPSLVRYIVLDLRANSGGPLNAAPGVVAPFVPRGSLVFTTDGKNGDARMKAYAFPEYYLRNSKDPDHVDAVRPLLATASMAILVDGSTASGGEIVAAALRQRSNTYIVGTRTAGMNDLQVIHFIIGNRGIKLTNGYWLTPTGQNIAGKGVDLDATFTPPDDPFASRVFMGTEHDANLKSALSYIKAR